MSISCSVAMEDIYREQDEECVQMGSSESSDEDPGETQEKRDLRRALRESRRDMHIGGHGGADVESKISLKLLVEKSSKKVVFAEAGKEFVDFLFSLLTLPVGVIVKLLNEHSMVGCLGKLYESVEKLSSEYIQPDTDKSLLLSPPTSSLPNDQNYPLLLQNDAATTPNKYYACDYGHYEYVTDVAGTPCPSCNYEMNNERKYVAPVAAAGSSSKGSGGFVMGVITYTVMDDLVVTPMSTISSIALLNRLSIKHVGGLEEKVVEVGMKEGLALLKASLQSNTVLTDVFIGKKDP